MGLALNSWWWLVAGLVLVGLFVFFLVFITKPRANNHIVSVHHNATATASSASLPSPFAVNAILGPNDPDDTTGCTFSAWSPWQGTCSSNNCGGFQFQTRTITAQDSDKPCGPGDTIRIRYCKDTLDSNVCGDEYQDCVLSETWSDWTGCADLECYDQCGDMPFEYRYKSILTPNGRYGKPCAVQEFLQFRACSTGGGPLPICNAGASNQPVNCVPEDWSDADWEGCPALCTPAGQPHPQEYRHRRPRIVAKNGGRDCTYEDLVESRDCALITCSSCVYEDWSPDQWQRCSVPCGTGTQFRVRDVLQQSTDGTQCNDTVEERECSVLQTCPAYTPTSSFPECQPVNWDYLVAQCGYICDRGGTVAPKEPFYLYDDQDNPIPACPLSDELLDLMCPRVDTGAPVSGTNPRQCTQELECVYEDWAKTGWGQCSLTCQTTAGDGAGAGQRVRHRQILSHGLEYEPCDFSLTEWLQPCNAATSYSSAPLFSCTAAPVQEANGALLKILPGHPEWIAAMSNATSVAAAQAACDAMERCAAFEMAPDGSRVTAVYARPMDYLIDNRYCSGSSTATLMDAPCVKNVTCEYSSWEVTTGCPPCDDSGTTGGPAPQYWEQRDVVRGSNTGVCDEPLVRAQPCNGLPACSGTPADCQYGPWPSQQGDDDCYDLDAIAIFPNSWASLTRQAWYRLPGLPTSGLVLTDLLKLSGIVPASMHGAYSQARLRQLLASVLNAQNMAGHTGLPIAAGAVNNTPGAEFAFAWNATAKAWDVLTKTESLTDPRCQWQSATEFNRLANSLQATVCDRAVDVDAGVFSAAVYDLSTAQCTCPALCPTIPDKCAWSKCHGTCGTGKQFMFRDIVAGPTGGGAPCEIGEQFMERDCDLGHPCTTADDCPYGPNGKQCSGPDHGECKLQSDGTEACECKAPWLGAACQTTCAVSTRTGTVCGAGEDAEHIRQANLQYVSLTPARDALVVQGWQRVAEAPNECNGVTGRCACHVQHWGAGAGYTGPACDQLCPPGWSGELCTVATPELTTLTAQLKHFEASDFVAWSGASDVIPIHSIYNYLTQNGQKSGEPYIAYAGGYNVHGFRMPRVEMDLTKLSQSIGTELINCFATNPGIACIAGLGDVAALSPVIPLKLSTLTWFPLRHVELPEAGLTWTSGTDPGTMYVGYHMVWVPSQEQTAPTVFPSGLEFDARPGQGTHTEEAHREWFSLYVLAVVWHDTGAAATSNHALAQRLWIASGDSDAVVLEHAVSGHRLRASTPNTWTMPFLLAPADNRTQPAFLSTTVYDLTVLNTDTTAATHLPCWGTPSQEPVAWSDAIQCVLDGINAELASP